MRTSVQFYPCHDIENAFRTDIALEKTFPFQSKYFQYRGFPEVRTPHILINGKEDKGSSSSNVVTKVHQV